METTLYKCVLCLRTRETQDPTQFPKCCGHYMEVAEVWERQRDTYLVSREYELSLLPAEEAARIRQLSGEHVGG